MENNKEASPQVMYVLHLDFILRFTYISFPLKFYTKGGRGKGGNKQEYICDEYSYRGKTKMGRKSKFMYEMNNYIIFGRISMEDEKYEEENEEEEYEEDKKKEKEEK